jgi:hypothetical protein
LVMRWSSCPNRTMKIKDLQFARHILLSELSLSPETAQQLLDVSIEIKKIGEPDNIIDRGTSILYTKPSSLTMFLFKVLYAVLSKELDSNAERDKLGLVLLQRCKEYVYHDFKPESVSGPPVIVDFDKVEIPSFIVHEIVEPLTGKLFIPNVLFMPCNFTDSCRLVESAGELEDTSGMPIRGRFDGFPLIVCNCNVKNSAAQLAHLLVVALRYAMGAEKTIRLLRHILLDRSLSVLRNVILILKALRGELDLTVNFLDLLQSHAMLSEEEQQLSDDLQLKSFASDSYFGQFLKTASPQTEKQWSQWSMLMGLIEKQLTPSRGSMWPATENLKPHEDKLRAAIKEDAKEKGKTQSNFEEMLEVARNMYNHNSVEPGQLIENLLKDTRIWKQ